MPPLPRPPPPPGPEEHPRQPQQPQAMSDEVLISASTSNIVLRPTNDSAASESTVQSTDLRHMHRKWVKLRHFEITENRSKADLSASSVLFRFYSDRSSTMPIINNGCEVQEMSVWLDDYEYLNEVAAGEGSMVQN